MSAFTEFLLLALALYLWESTLWLPLRGVVLRRKWSGTGWTVGNPASWIAGRRRGLVPMRPFPSDSGLAPCQAPPLVACEDGRFLIETDSGGLVFLRSVEWSDLGEEDSHLLVKGVKTRLTSLRALEHLRRSKARGVTIREGVAGAWKSALSPTRAGREWRRWTKVSAPLRFYGPFLMIGTFVGLPLAYIYLGNLQVLVLAGWLWLLMAFTGGHLWWLGKRVYPAAKAALRLDAVLCFFVPFHAMRGLEIASVHAMGATHPLGLLLWSGDWENPWLGRFIRRVIHPLPGSGEEAAFATAMGAPLASALGLCGKTPAAFDHAPDRGRDQDSTQYCPRCHSLFLAGVTGCPDCRELKLEAFGGLSR